jgi:hypothetical protein
MPLIDLDCGRLQISLDSIKCQDSESLLSSFMATAMLALGVLNTCQLSRMSNVGQIMTDIVLGTHAYISRIFFYIL